MVHEAFYVARSGRPGPVVIDLPKDILIGTAPYADAGDRPHRSYRPQTEPDPAQIAEAVALLKRRQAADHLCRRRRDQRRAGGARGADASSSRMTGFPCTNTLMGLGAFPASDPQFLGMLGMHGTYEANLAMHGCDVMLNVGARFDDRVTGRLNAFSPGSKKIHIDIDPSSINKNVPVDVPIVGDAGARAGGADRGLGRGPTQRRTRPALAEWWQQIDDVARQGLPALHPGHAPGAIIKPQYAIQRLYELTRAIRPRHLHHHRGRPAPDVGGAVFPASTSRTAG